ncbi:MAG: 5'/3'-nucleotidase SurE [Candidatus Schekmanbacteria bacterium]|nr:5'/3'-nucleotidase SurE [Candidatus Schekmanbacteria bacterium]
MHILLTNDDGIHAPGIQVLYQALKDIAEVTVVAPEYEQSAIGHAITIYNPLRVSNITNPYNGFKGYAVNGTPADCVKLGVGVILDDKPDMVVSGINLGMNAGDCLLYSGTVSAATEAVILQIPSFAISLATYGTADFGYAALFARQLAEKIRDNGLPKGTFLNVNVPALSPDQIKGVAITRQGRFTFRDKYEQIQDSFGRTYYWLRNEIVQLTESGNFDLQALKEHKVSITPVKYDLTDYEYMHELEKWQISV